MTDAERAWAAGFFDGEGNVGYREREQASGPTRVRVAQIAQVDRRALDRFVEIVGIGRVRGPYERNTKNGSSYFVWSSRDVEAVYEALKPWLVSKQDQFEEVIALWNAFRPRLCEHGSERQKCSPCRSEWITRSWATRKARAA
jgi:hypothetical protein